MTKYILLILATVLSLNAFSQDLMVNKVDEFTGDAVRRTSWETLNMSMSFTAFFRVSKINDNQYIDLKMMIGGGKVFSIGEGDELMLKLSNDEIIKLPNLEHTITCTGCGAKGFSGSSAPGIQVSYPLTSDQLQILKRFPVVKIRIYTQDGYVESGTNSRQAERLITALKLVEG